MLKLYGYKKCSTCRKAEKFLEGESLKYEFVDITLAPPALAKLKDIVKRSGQPLTAFYNTSGEFYKKLDIKNRRKGLSEADQLKLLASNGRLLKRPILDDGRRASVGFRPDVEAIWK